MRRFSTWVSAVQPTLQHFSCGMKNFISFKHLESARKVLSRRLKKIARVWIRINPTLPATCKVGDKRMGKGKGEVISRIFKVRCGMVLFEVEGSNSQAIVELLKKAKKKIPVKMKVVINE